MFLSCRDCAEAEKRKGRKRRGKEKVKKERWGAEFEIRDSSKRLHDLSGRYRPRSIVADH